MLLLVLLSVCFLSRKTKDYSYANGILLFVLLVIKRLSSEFLNVLGYTVLN